MITHFLLFILIFFVKNLICLKCFDFFSLSVREVQIRFRVRFISFTHMYAALHMSSKIVCFTSMCLFYLVYLVHFSRITICDYEKTESRIMWYLMSRSLSKLKSTNNLFIFIDFFFFNKDFICTNCNNLIIVLNFPNFYKMKNIFDKIHCLMFFLFRLTLTKPLQVLKLSTVFNISLLFQKLLLKITNTESNNSTFDYNLYF